MNDDLERRLREQGMTAPGVTVDPERVWTHVRRRRRARVAASSAGVTAAVVAVAVVAGGGLGDGWRADELVPLSALGSDRPTPSLVDGRTEYRGVSLTLEPGELTARDVATAQTEFGVDLLHAVCAAEPGANVLLSPLSAAQTVGMLQPAVDDAAGRGIADVLHLPGWSPGLQAALHEHTAVMQRLAAEDDPDEDADRVRVSNRVWLQEDVVPQQAYLDAVATAYDAGLGVFGSAHEGTELINDAVGQDTDGLIPSLFDEDLDENTRVVLTNAIHLTATWSTEFETAVDADFTTPRGDVEVDMMTEGSGTRRTVDGWTSVEIPYTDGTLTATVLLPASRTDPCTVQADDLAALTVGDGTTVDVSMPRLQLSQEHDLLPVLTGLGLPTGGSFPAFGNAVDTIDQVVQKTVMDVDEEGTVAAAATGLSGTFYSSSGTRAVVVDRPFVLLVTDTETRSPLFLGVVNDPTQP